MLLANNKFYSEIVFLFLYSDTIEVFIGNLIRKPSNGPQTCVTKHQSTINLDSTSIFVLSSTSEMESESIKNEF